jgi:hypothetical protein
MWLNEDWGTVLINLIYSALKFLWIVQTNSRLTVLLLKSLQVDYIKKEKTKWKKKKHLQTFWGNVKQLQEKFSCLLIAQGTIYSESSQQIFYPILEGPTPTIILFSHFYLPLYCILIDFLWSYTYQFFFFCEKRKISENGLIFAKIFVIFVSFREIFFSRKPKKNFAKFSGQIFLHYRENPSLIILY